MDQWMGNLFFRGAHPLEIESMYFHQLSYWNGWHEAMERAEKAPSVKPGE
jgi:hypothetical protein